MRSFTRTSSDIQKVLFVLLHPGFVRFYSGTIASLIKKGCYVSVVFTQVHKKMGGIEGLPLDQGDLTVDCRAFPRRTDMWKGFARTIRIADDYLHYLTADYKDADYLRRRTETDLPPILKPLTLSPRLPRPVVHAAQAVLRGLERLIPPVPEAVEVLKEHTPHIVVISPLVERELAQIEVVKAARAAGLHNVLAVGSWDHLTTKRVLMLKPDKILLWNQKQKDEAVTMHGVDPDDVVITGAPVFDQWFGREPVLTREKFFRRAGLEGDGPMIVYAGSSPQIVKGEVEAEFVACWREALRAKLPERYKDINILVRPHPVNYAHWTEPPQGVTVFPPPVGTNPVNKLEQSDYFHTLHYADAVVGLNTSACVEASICGAPTLTVVGQADARQTDTLHFRLLTPEEGGPLLVAHDFDEHVAHLVDVLDHPEAHKARIEGFVESFVRPCGLADRATNHFVRAITDIGWSPQPPPQRDGAIVRALRAVVAIFLRLGQRPPTPEQRVAEQINERKAQKREGRLTADVKTRRSKFPEGRRARYIRPAWQTIPGYLEALNAEEFAEDEEEELTA
jgi:hypothetical protein